MCVRQLVQCTRAVPVHAPVDVSVVMVVVVVVTVALTVSVVFAVRCSGCRCGSGRDCGFGCDCGSGRRLLWLWLRAYRYLWLRL